MTLINSVYVRHARNAMAAKNQTLDRKRHISQLAALNTVSTSAWRKWSLQVDLARFLNPPRFDWRGLFFGNIHMWGSSSEGSHTWKRTSNLHDDLEDPEIEPLAPPISLRAWHYARRHANLLIPLSFHAAGVRCGPAVVEAISQWGCGDEDGAIKSLADAADSQGSSNDHKNDEEEEEEEGQGGGKAHDSDKKVVVVSVAPQYTTMNMMLWADLYASIEEAIDCLQEAVVINTKRGGGYNNNLQSEEEEEGGGSTDNEVKRSSEKSARAKTDGRTTPTVLLQGSANDKKENREEKGNEDMTTTWRRIRTALIKCLSAFQSLLKSGGAGEKTQTFFYALELMCSFESAPWMDYEGYYYSSNASSNLRFYSLLSFMGEKLLPALVSSSDSTNSDSSSSSSSSSSSCFGEVGRGGRLEFEAAALTKVLDFVRLVWERVVALRKRVNVPSTCGPLEAIPKCLFDIRGVEEVVLTRLGIKTVSPRLVKRLDRLVMLNLTANQLRSLPAEAAAAADTLTELFLSENQLECLPKAMRRLRNLTVLDVSRNEFPELGDAMVALLPRLRKLYIGRNKLSKLPVDIKNAVNLEELQAQENCLAALPEQICDMKSLVEMNLCNNGLKILPDGFGALTSLRRLLLSQNRLSSLPNSFSHITRLGELRLGNNELVSLPDNMGKNWASITVLRLDNNKLMSLPPSIAGMEKLGSLYLEHNELASLPPEILNLSHLSSLMLCNNKLKSLPMFQPGHLPACTGVYCRDNQLSTLPKGLENLSSFRYLGADRNRIESLDGKMLAGCPKLEYISLDDNKIVSLPKEIGLLKGLKRIELKGNSAFLSLPSEFVRLNNLCEVGLDQKVRSLASRDLEKFLLACEKRLEERRRWEAANYTGSG